MSARREPGRSVWSRGGRRLRTTIIYSFVVCLAGHPFPAAEAESGVGGDQDERPAVDCRYESGAAGDEAGAGRSKGVPFPSDDVFRPLFADPKQPQFFAAYQAVSVRQTNTSANIGSVGFGENFGLYSKRVGCNGWQVGILAGVFSQFNLDAPSSDLLNTDFVVGIPSGSERLPTGTGILIEAEGFQIQSDGSHNPATATGWKTVGYFKNNGVPSAPDWVPGVLPSDGIAQPPGATPLTDINDVDGCEFLRLRFTFYMPSTMGPTSPGPFVDEWVIRFIYDQ